MLDEFGQADDPRRGLVQRLGEDEYGRLVVLGARTVEIAHEALITQWPWLAARLNADANDVRRLDRLTMRSKEWIAAPDDERFGYLATGVERELFEGLAERRPDWLSSVDHDFVDSSNRSYLAAIEERKAQYKAARRNASLALTALASLDAERRPMNAAKLALAAWPRNVKDEMPKLKETLDVLIRILPSLRLRRILNCAANFVAFNPDGSQIATTSLRSNEAQILNANSGTLVVTLKGHEGPVTSAAFSRDKLRIVTASMDNTARVWDTASGDEIAVLRGHQNWVRSAAFSPDDTRVVTASDDGTARVWDLASGKEIITFTRHRSGSRSRAFDPDGMPLDEGSSVRCAAFSPDGTNVVTASDDKTVRVWGTVSVRSEQTNLWSRFVIALRKLMLAEKFDRDDVVFWSRVIGLRKLAEKFGRDEVVLTHDEAVYSAAFSPDGNRVVTASADDTVRIWDPVSGNQLIALIGHTGQVNSAAFSSDGTFVVTASDDKTARLWDAGSGQEIAALRGHQEEVSFAALSPDGRQIITASSDQIRLWDAFWAKCIAILQGHEDPRLIPLARAARLVCESLLSRGTRLRA